MAQGIRVVVPLWREHAWHGCLLLGEKASGDAYTTADTFLLQTISAQTSLALENVRSHEELLHLNTELEDRISKRTQELANANAQLRAADSAKDRFLAIVSHELVNPLTSIIAWAEVGRYSDEDRIIRRAFDIIKQSGEQQNLLVRDLLDTSRMIHGKLAVRLQPADLWQVLQQTLDDFVHRMREKQLKLVVLPPAQPMYSRIDPERMQEVISNLLANAVKFTEPGGVITVRGCHDATGNSITVQDTGKGIPAEKLTSIFQLFQQGTDDEFKGGLGLGLALVDGIMRLHGGTVTAASLGIGQGSTFTLTLPVAPLPDDFDLPDEDVCLEEPLLSSTSAFETVK